MENKICCKYFNLFAKNYEFMILDIDVKKKYIMPHITDINDIKIRVNYCPSCGAEIRDIELSKKQYEKIRK